MYHRAEMVVNLSELLKYFRKGERTDQISELTNKSAATSGKRKSLTSDLETGVFFIQVKDVFIQENKFYALICLIAKFLLKIKCYPISFREQ